MTTHETYTAFKKYIVRMGRITLAAALICSFFPGLYLAIFEGTFPGFAMILKAFAPIFLAFIIIWCIEPISYFPILGLTGTFVSWLSGNILNLRIPCSVICQQVAEVKEGTEEGDIFSTIGLCVSVFVNIIIVFIFAIAGVQILAALPPAIKESFNYLLPAILGSMMMSFATRNFKVCGIAVLITLICKLGGVSTTIDMALIVFPTIFIALGMYRKGWIK
jgi:hypothetical protein